MLNWFTKLRKRRENDALFRNILSFVRKNLSQENKIQYCLSDLPPSEQEQDKQKTVSSIKEETLSADRFKFSLREDVVSDVQFSIKRESSVYPRMEIVDGELTLVDGEADMPSFTNEVKRLMHERGMTGSELCKRILMDRRLWSKLNTDSEYQPSRETATAICLALRLNEDQAQELLKAAGYTLSATHKQDVVMRYFLQNQIYDIDVINDMLYRFGLKCIGTHPR